MSDIRAQSRRDAEFDRLLVSSAGIYSGARYHEHHVREAYEMGKRHGREEIEVKVAYSHSFMPRDIDHVRADEVKS